MSELNFKACSTLRANFCIFQSVAVQVSLCYANKDTESAMNIQQRTVQQDKMAIPKTSRE